MMHLIDNYYIDTTGYGVTLQTATGKDKNGEQLYKPTGYYSNIEQAIEACAIKRISNRIAAGMHDYPGRTTGNAGAVEKGNVSDIKDGEG